MVKSLFTVLEKKIVTNLDEAVEILVTSGMYQRCTSKYRRYGYIARLSSMLLLLLLVTHCRQYVAVNVGLKYQRLWRRNPILLQSHRVEKLKANTSNIAPEEILQPETGPQLYIHTPPSIQLYL